MPTSGLVVSVFGGADCGSYLGLFNSYGFWIATSMAVRPVVSLGSNVTKAEVSKTTAKADTTWDNADNSNLLRSSGEISGEKGKVSTAE